jgi:precorrin-6A/cobalt-precorrin-6A reductase
LVARNSGGMATYAKIAAARTLRLPVIMISRPPLPACATVADVQGAIGWLDQWEAREAE